MRANLYAFVLPRNACSAKRYELPAPGYSLANSEYEIAVAYASNRAAKIPAHIARPDGYAYPAWTTNVIHRNAPGAMSAMALTVTPVKPRVGTIFFCSSAILCLLRFHGGGGCPPCATVGPRYGREHRSAEHEGCHAKSNILG